MSIIDDLIQNATPRTSQVRVFARSDLVERHAELLAELNSQLPLDNSASLADPDGSTELAEEIDRLQEEMEASAVTFDLRSVSSLSWTNLLAEYPPTREQQLIGYDSNPDGFQPPAVAMCITGPEKVTADQMRVLRDRLTAGEWNKLWMAVLGLNVTETPLPKVRVASAIRQLSGLSDKPSAAEGSLGLSSSDDSSGTSPSTSTTPTGD